MASLSAAERSSTGRPQSGQHKRLRTAPARVNPLPARRCSSSDGGSSARQVTQSDKARARIRLISQRQQQQRAALAETANH